MAQVNHWCRAVMNGETLRLVQSIHPEEKDILEISGNAWADLVPHRSYRFVHYPAFDICAQPLAFKQESFDLIIAEQVFEHLPYPYRAGKNIYSMLRPGGYMLLTTPFFIKVHKSPLDCCRWTEEGIKFLMEECGFNPKYIHTGSWGNRLCVIANFQAWPEYIPGAHPLDNEPDFPMVVWTLAQKEPA
jgi:SAM-dependent methyltransferase